MVGADHQLRALLGEPLRQRPPDPARRARHDDDPSLIYIAFRPFALQLRAAIHARHQIDHRRPVRLGILEVVGARDQLQASCPSRRAPRRCRCASLGNTPMSPVLCTTSAGRSILASCGAALALRRLQAPHRQPGPQRVGPADAGQPVRLRRMAAIAAGAGAVRRIDRRIHEAQVGPGAVEREQDVGNAGGVHARQLGLGPVGDALVARALRGAVARDERRPSRAARCPGLNGLSDGSVLVGSNSSTTEASIQSVSTSGRPLWAFSET